ncbi:6-aminohexanoate hydrolase, partial [Bacillus wiedmannii]|nr:6-aminohexanoate hydrolase [Bacillus wiedmannii]
MDFKQLENKFEKKKVNTFLVYQKGELTNEYYKTIECSSNLYKINSITKSIVSILIG